MKIKNQQRSSIKLGPLNIAAKAALPLQGNMLAYPALIIQPI